MTVQLLEGPSRCAMAQTSSPQQSAWSTNARISSRHRRGVPLGHPDDRLADQTRHRSLNVLLDRHIRPLKTLAATSSSDLGL
ncbi:hypothetical protein [Nocardioides sp. NPDC127503]|uniref:hypothetical protein n=1 Tax=Nocardioides sp. NPDC127503 TaxID=3154516 RepID=UPI003321873E